MTRTYYYQNKQQTTIKKGEFSYDSPDWVLHNGIGYIFPQGGRIFLCNQQQTGSWYDINHTESKEMQQREVFTLGFNHGTNPRNATYAYIIAPGITCARQMNAYNKKNGIEILANTDAMQIVRNREAEYLANGILPGRNFHSQRYYCKSR